MRRPSRSPADRIPAPALRRLAREVLAAAGWGAEDAELIAEALVDSSLRGVDSHGVLALLPVYARAAAAGAGRPPPAVVRDEAGAVLVDGAGGLGLRAARLAVDLAVERAGRTGVAAVAARNLGYLGALSWIVEPGARRGAVTLAACTSQAWVAPHGGVEALHGTNPIAVAIPSEPDPIVLDMRTNALRMADYLEGLRTGRPLPEGGVVDREGRPVRAAASVEEAVVLPLAGAKGYGLALVVDVLCAALADGPIGRELDAEREESEVSAFFLALDPALFGGSEAFAGAVSRLADQVRATTPLAGGDPVRLPGERGLAERRRRLEDGIPIDGSVWARMVEALEQLGLEVPVPAHGESEP